MLHMRAMMNPANAFIDKLNCVTWIDPILIAAFVPYISIV